MEPAKLTHEPEVFVTGIGVTTAIGQGQAAFSSALLEGRSNFRVMQRPGRQCAQSQNSPFLGAEITQFTVPASIPKHILRTASLSAQVALATLHEAWQDANLDDVDPLRVGLVVGGSNFQQRELVLIQESYRDRVQFLRPTYGMSFMDSDVCGLCTEHFGIRGFAYTVGSASASGQVAAIQAIQAVQSQQVDVCIVLGALMDLSYWECQAFRSISAMGSERFATQPALACRPFDRDRDGFIYGESCGALVIERSRSAAGQDVAPYARIAGWSMRMDGNRNPDPSLQGEVGVIRQALQRAGWSAEEVDYINPHGTGSIVGDETELNALRECGLGEAYLNATKSIIGHGLTAAGTVEIIATLIQMKQRRLHPTLNLERPIQAGHRWVGSGGEPHVIQKAVKLSFGFGGVNTAVCLQRI